MRLTFPLWPDPAAAAATTASTAAQAGAEATGGGGAEGGGVDVMGEEGPVFVYGRAGVRLRMEWTQADGNRPPGMQFGGRGGGSVVSLPLSFVTGSSLGSLRVRVDVRARRSGSS